MNTSSQEAAEELYKRGEHMLDNMDGYTRESFSEILGIFDKALELEPDYAPCLEIKGFTLILAGRKSEAVSCLKKALAIDPLLSGACVNLVSILRETGRDAEALDYLVDSAHAKPESESRWYDLAIGQMRLGLYMSAISSLIKALEIQRSEKDMQGKEAVTLFALGMAKDRLGDKLGASQTFREVATMTGARETIQKEALTAVRRLEGHADPRP